MDFFEELGRRLVEIGREMLQYAKNFTTINQLTGKIYAGEKQLNQQYLQLGKAYYEANHQQAEAPHADVMAQITDLEAQLADHREQYAQLQQF